MKQILASLLLALVIPASHLNAAALWRTISDTFSGGDGFPANWTNTLNCPDCTVDTGVLRGPNMPASWVSRVITYTGSSFSNDQSAQSDVGGVTAQKYAGQCVRVTGSGATADGYCSYYTNTSLYIFLLEDGVLNTLLENCGAGVVTVSKIDATGTTISLYGGTTEGTMSLICDVSDATYASGAPGLLFDHDTSENSATHDNFKATGEVGGSPSFVPSIINAPVRGGGLWAFAWPRSFVR